MSDRSQRPVILLVDDDQLIIGSLRSLFLLETDYELLTARDAKQGLEHLERRAVDIVISDFLMPGMNGVQFLKKVRELQPDAVRILLTGFADKENAIRAINEVGLYHYLEKPWNNEDLLLLVRNALRELTLRRQLKEKVGELDRLIVQHRRLETEHSDLSRDLEMAARVQRSLLPDQIPSCGQLCAVAYYEPSSLLGGDLYDFLPIDDGQILLLADASGHGMGAALTSMLLKASFREAAAEASGPAELLDGMNRRLHRFLPTGMFACATIAWAGDSDGSLRVANAGLPHPYVLRAERRVDELALNGMPLGLFEESIPGAYDSREVELGPGETLLLVTDGLLEAQNEAGEQFQQSELRRAFERLCEQGGGDVSAQLVEAASTFSKTFRDDVSLLALRRSEP